MNTYKGVVVETAEIRFPTLIAYDTELMRVGCPILQAALGGNARIPSYMFDAIHWLTSPTKGLKVMAINEAQLKILIEKTKKAHSLNKGLEKIV